MGGITEEDNGVMAVRVARGLTPPRVPLAWALAVRAAARTLPITAVGKMKNYSNCGGDSSNNAAASQQQ